MEATLQSAFVVSKLQFLHILQREQTAWSAFFHRHFLRSTFSPFLLRREWSDTFDVRGEKLCAEFITKVIIVIIHVVMKALITILSERRRKKADNKYAEKIIHMEVWANNLMRLLTLCAKSSKSVDIDGLEYLAINFFD